MKFEIKVDLTEWDHSNEYLKEHIENRIIETISEKVTKQIFNDVYIDASSKMAVKIDSFIDEALATFTDRQISVTDKWGDVVEKYENLKEMLQERFDQFMTGAVDSNGKPAKKGCSYGDKDTRIKYLVNEAASASINKFTKGIASTVDSQIKSMLKKSLQDELSDTVFKSIDVKKLLRGF